MTLDEWEAAGEPIDLHPERPPFWEAFGLFVLTAGAILIGLIFNFT